MKAPKTTSPELTAEDLLKNIKENIHLIKYREIPWINIMSCPSFLWSSSRESKSKTKKFAKKEIDARVPRGTLGASPNSLREATDFAGKKGLLAAHCECQQTCTFSHIFTVHDQEYKMCEEFRRWRRFEPNAVEVMDILYKLFVRNLGRFTLKSQTL